MILEGKTAWITGAGMGIGRATALRFAAEGASLVLADVEGEALLDVMNEVVTGGGKAVGIEGSVASEDDVKRMVEAALENYGRLDILINNAGINRDGLVVRVKEGEVKLMGDSKWDPVIEVNLKGTFMCARAAAVPMMEQKSGRIVNTSSIAVLGNPGQANYAASKAGIIGLTRTLALEWSRFNITVNCVAPGATKTRMTEGIPEKMMEGLMQKIPLRRMGEPEEIAEAHLFFASDAASYITGQVLFVDGGISVGV